MKSFLITFSLFLFSLTLVSSLGKIPKIDIYIESLCPDCTGFISSSFADFYNYNVPNLAEVNFIPFGNAQEKFDEATQKWLFTCQHKENECYGNLIETCAINILGRVRSYEILICIESNIFKYDKDFDEVLKNCVYDDRQLESIKSCVSGDWGNKYQHEMAQKTPEHKWVPWVVVDGVHDEYVENLILNDMLDYLCSLPQSKCKDDYMLRTPSNFLGMENVSKCYIKDNE